MKEILINGLLDTVFGMGIVFILLIFLAGLIGLLKYIPILIGKFSKKEDTSNVLMSKSIENTISQIETKEQGIVPATNHLMNDQELVAVITAAIMASMGEAAPVDGLVVRSIKKANKTTWIRA